MTVLYLVSKHPATPLFSKLFTVLVVGYALSPLDLIPDMIPVLGYLDDLILVPIGIYLALKTVPASIVEECKSQAQAISTRDLPKNRAAASIIVLLWIATAVFVTHLLYQLL